MSDERARSRIGNWALGILGMIVLAPMLLLGLSYVEHAVAGTHRLKDALHIDQVVHQLDAISRHR